MEIKIATKNDINKIMLIIADAKKLLKDSGSLQWNTPDGYPNENSFLKDIELQQLYVIWDNDIACGVMACVNGIDNNYNKINGAWLTNGPYLSVHRIAVKKEYYHTGVSKKLMSYAIDLAERLNLVAIRVDTHPINIPMQKLLLHFNFKHCGEINLLGRDVDSLRLAYELIIPTKN